MGGALGGDSRFRRPEMLTDDVLGRWLGAGLPLSMYAAASVLYQLMEGHSPYDLSFAGRSQREGRSAYRTSRTRSSQPRRPPVPTERRRCSRPVLAPEPGSRSSGAYRCRDWMAPPAHASRSAALSAVDDQLAEVLMACLVPEQSRRPQAREVREALALFCSQYADNVARSLRGEPLAPCPLGGAAATAARRRRRLRRATRVAVDALSAAVAVGGAVAAGLLTQDVAVAFPAGQPLWSGPMPGLAVSAALLLPLRAPLSPRQQKNTGFGFVRGLLGSLLGGTVAGLLASLTRRAVGLRRALCGAVFSPSSLLYRDWSPIGPWRCLRCRLRPPPPPLAARLALGCGALPRIVPSRLRAARPHGIRDNVRGNLRIS